MRWEPSSHACSSVGWPGCSSGGAGSKAGRGGWCLAVTSYLSGQALLSVALVLLGHRRPLELLDSLGAFAGVPGGACNNYRNGISPKPGAACSGCAPCPQELASRGCAGRPAHGVSMLQGQGFPGTPALPILRDTSCDGPDRDIQVHRRKPSGIVRLQCRADASGGLAAFRERPPRLLSWSMAGPYLISLSLMSHRAGLGRGDVVLAMAIGVDHHVFPRSRRETARSTSSAAATALGHNPMAGDGRTPETPPRPDVGAGLLAKAPRSPLTTYVFPLALLCVVGALGQGGTANETFRLRFRQAVPDWVLMAAFAAFPPLFYLPGTNCAGQPHGTRAAYARRTTGAGSLLRGRVAGLAGTRRNGGHPAGLPVVCELLHYGVVAGNLGPLFLASVPLWLASEARGTVSVFDRRVLVVANLPSRRSSSLPSPGGWPSRARHHGALGTAAHPRGLDFPGRLVTRLAIRAGKPVRSGNMGPGVCGLGLPGGGSAGQGETALGPCFCPGRETSSWRS